MRGEIRVATDSAARTEEIGYLVGRAAAQGGVIALFGDLASGKTTFVRGVARDFARANQVHSPTFTLVNVYGEDNPLYHLDLYRLSDPFEALDLGCEELFDGERLCLVEWADRAAPLLPEKRIDIEFLHVGQDRRELCLTNTGLLQIVEWKKLSDAILRA